MVDVRDVNGPWAKSVQIRKKTIPEKFKLHRRWFSRPAFDLKF